MPHRTAARIADAAANDVMLGSLVLTEALYKAQESIRQTIAVVISGVWGPKFLSE